MRTLKFIVNGQTIRSDPNCDFTGLVPGSEGYLKIEFAFSSEWSKFTKVVTFWSSLGKEMAPQILEDGKTCMVPNEILSRRIFGIQVIGKKDDFKLVTNKIFVHQEGGKQ